MKQRIVGGGLGVVAVLVAAWVASAWASDRPVSELAAKWAPPPSVFVAVNGMQVHVRDEGPREDPEPILLLHGTSASLHTWEGWASTLRASRRVIRCDLPGFGLTGPTPDGDYSLEAYTRFVDALLQERGVARAALVGNSFGGAVAWTTALDYPARVARLVLVDSSGYPQDAASSPLGLRVARLPVLNRLALVLLPRSLVERSLARVYGDPTLVTPELVDRYWELTLREGNRRAVAERLKQAPTGAGAHRVPGVKVPTLIMWGGQDRLFPVSHARQFERDIAGSRVVVFDDLGHVPQEEAPGRTVGVVAEFLAAR